MPDRHFPLVYTHTIPQPVEKLIVDGAPHDTESRGKSADSKTQNIRQCTCATPTFAGVIANIRMLAHRSGALADADAHREFGRNKCTHKQITGTDTRWKDRSQRGRKSMRLRAEARSILLGHVVFPHIHNVVEHIIRQSVGF